MNIDEALSLLSKEELSVFNAYRDANPSWIPDFSNQDLSEYDLVDSNSGCVNLNLNKAILTGTKLPDDYFFDYNGKTPSLQGAIIDTETSGQPLGTLVERGAQFTSKAEIQKQNEAKSTRIFISYAWANTPVVTAIDKWLRLKGLDTKIDKRDFFAGSRIRDEISRLMKESDVVLMFHSRESKDKPWIEFERELVADIQMVAKQEGANPPRVIYIVIDGTPLPNISEANRIAIIAKGKRFELVCEEIYHHILQIPRETNEVDLSQWNDYVF